MVIQKFSVIQNIDNYLGFFLSDNEFNPSDYGMSAEVAERKLEAILNGTWAQNRKSTRSLKSSNLVAGKDKMFATQVS